jgi:Zn-dependent protease with chaperone function
MIQKIAAMGILLAVLCLSGLALAQESTPTPAPVAVESVLAPSHEPVPVPQPDALTIQRYRSGNIVWAVNQLLGLALPLLFLATGWSARLRDKSARWGRRWYFSLAIYFTLLSLAMGLLQLPWSFYVEYVREHAYGLSNQTLGKWMKDTAITTLLGIVVGVAIIWVPYLLLKKSPRRWWVYTGLLVLPLLILQVFITPIWIEPLFNNFGPMKDKALEAKILDLASRSGIEGARVFEVEKSEDTKAVNAYVNGFMDTKRIVLWDTAIEKLKEDELLFVMGHEMGHFVMNHVARFIVLGFVVIFISFYVIHRLSGTLIRRYGARWGFSELSDIASLPLILLMMQVMSLVVTPALFGITRHHEHEADRFSLELTHLNHAAATGFVTLQQENLANPNPGWFFTLWRGSHPSIAQRIEFFNRYRPWETGEPLKYGTLFEGKE